MVALFFVVVLGFFSSFFLNRVGIYLPVNPGALILLLALPIMFGAWVWGLIDAYKGAEAHNARHGLN